MRRNGSSLTLAADAPGKGPGEWRLSGYLTRVHKGHAYQYEFLIATVPDPVGSKFAHEFDAVVEGIQRAYEARGFILRAAQLPWPRPAGRDAADVKVTRSAADRPGVLLFRESRDPRPNDPDDKVVFRFALVCLVGENPISGVHKPALTEALKAREELAGAIAEARATNDRIGWVAGTGRTSPDKTRLVAPYFTGSQWSLVHTLAEWKKGKGREATAFEIVNGSSTAVRPAGFTQRGIAAPESTVIPSELLVLGVLRYLGGSRDARLNGPVDPIPHRVAILRESNTGFGALAGMAWKDTQDKTSPEGAAGKESVRYTLPLPEGEALLDLPFPISISQLPASLEVGKAGVSLPHTDFVEPRLPVRDRSRFDAVPAYDPEAAASTAGQTLRAIMTTIDRARVRYVGILASDTRDVVFLNRLLQKECPSVRVFTTEPGIALLHPEEATRLRGMVVGSTYPLSPTAQFWGRGGLAPRQMLSFPTQGSQGYYNAVLAQCGRHDLMLGYHPPKLGEYEPSAGDRADGADRPRSGSV